MNENNVVSSAPGRIDLSGGATDWCGMHTLSLAINLRAKAEVSLLKDTSLIQIEIGNEFVEYKKPRYGGNLDLFKSVIELSGLKGFKVKYETNIPKGSGLGGSAPLTVATLHSLNKLFRKKWSLYYIAELAQRAERLKLKTVQGLQDQYTAVFGGLVYMDFRNKECQKGKYSKPVEKEPYATIEKLDQYCPNFHIIIAVPQVERVSSNQTNQELSELYLNGNKKVVNQMKYVASLTQLAKKAVVDGKIQLLYEIINKNNNIMIEWGWLSKYNLEVMKIAKKNGALAIKTCGAGRGAMAIFAKDKNHQKQLFELIKPKVTQIYKVKKDKGVKFI